MYARIVPPPTAIDFQPTSWDCLRLTPGRGIFTRSSNFPLLPDVEELFHFHADFSAFIHRLDGELGENLILAFQFPVNTGEVGVGDLETVSQVRSRRLLEIDRRAFIPDDVV